MSSNENDLIERLHALAEGFEMPPGRLADDVRRGRGRVRRNRGLLAGAAAAVVAVLGIVAFTSNGPQAGKSIDPVLPGPSQDSVPTPTASVNGELVLKLQTWRQGYVELAVYSDGWVIWVPSHQDGYLQMRLTPGGVDRLSERAASTGLFERDLALGLNLDWGNLEVHREGRSVVVAWGKVPQHVSGLGMQDQFVDATPSQASALTALEEFLTDPLSWELPRDMYAQPKASPFVPTHLWVSWDRSKPDPSKLPSPAREVLTSNLEAVLDGRCELITIAQAADIAQVMDYTGDTSHGIAFDMPGEGGPVSFLHAHPSLPHESTCD